MKTLHLMRHGKSSRDNERIADIDRPLIDKGIRNTVVTAEQFRARYRKPDLIISSPAQRALQTAVVFAKFMGYPEKRIKVVDRLYDAADTTISSVVTDTRNDVESLMLVGHNPGFTDLANWFLEPAMENVQTSGIVTIEFSCKQWSDFRESEHSAGYLGPKTRH